MRAPSAAAVPWHAEIERFLAGLSLERGLSANTLLSYRIDLQLFEAFCAQRGLGDVARITGTEVRRFLQWLRDTPPARTQSSARSTGREAATVARKLACVRSFFRFLVNEGALKKNPTAFLESPKLWRKLPSTLSEDEVRRILDTIGKDPMAPRDLALFELLYGAGLRVSELASLRVQDVNLEAGFLRCIGKGDKERLVPIGHYARDAVRRYLAELRPKLTAANPSSATLFIARGRALTRQRIWQLVRRYAERAQVSKRIGPHTFRHSFATHLLTHGADLRVVQELLGHANITTTQRYTQVDRARLKSVHEQFHPRP